MPGERLVIVINSCAVPESENRKEQLSEDIHSALAPVLDDHQTFPERINIYTGDVYSQVDCRCPECKEQLRLRLVEPDNRNGATAPAMCDCGWTGNVIYRIINVVENPDDFPESSFNTESVVENYEPLYVPYAHTTLHSFSPSEN